MMAIDKVVIELLKEIEILKDNSTGVTDEVREALKRIKGTLTAFGWYDPASFKDYELYRKLHEDIAIVFDKLHI